MKFSRPPQDVLVTAGTIAVLSALFAVAVWWPNARAKAEHERRVDEATQRVATIDASEAQRMQLEQQVLDLESGLETDEHYVPTSPQLSAMLRGLTESARASGVWEQELTADEFKRFADFSVIPASLRFGASFGSAIGVLEAIEKQRRLTAVHRTSIGHTGPRDAADATTPSQVKLEVDLVSFFAREQEATR